MKKFSIMALLAVLILSAVSLYAQPVIDYKSLDEKIPNMKEVVTGKFDNGLTYFIRQNKKPANRAELMIIIRAGACYEDEDQKGLAHLNEHLCFNGTKNFPKDQLVKFLESIGMKFGAELNAYTSFDETVYFLKVPTDNEETLEKAMQILEDWGHNVAFDPTEVDKERGVVLEEQRGGRGAGERIQNKHLPVILHDSRYAVRLPIGDTNVVKNASHDVIKRFYYEWYRPELMSVVVVGDFEIEKMQQMIEKHFKGLTNPKNVRERIQYTVPDNKGILVSIASDKELTNPMINIMFKYPKLEKGTFREYREGYVQNFYNHMFNQRIQEIIRKPNAPFLYAGGGMEDFLSNLNAASFIALTKEDGIIDGFSGVLTEAYRIQQHGFTPGEFERAKKEMLRSNEKMLAEKGKEESDDLAQELKRHVLTGESYAGVDMDYALSKKFINEITLQEVNDLSKHIMQNDNVVITVSVPEKAGVAVPTEAQVIAKLEEVRNAKHAAYVDKVKTKPLFSKEPEPGTITSTENIKELDVTVWTLSNGMKMYLKKTDFKNDEIMVSGYSWGGTSLAPDNIYHSAENASSIVARGGLGKNDADAIERILTGKMASCQTSIDDFTQDLGAYCSPQDMEIMFQLINLHFTEPRKDKEAYRAMIEKMKASIKNSENAPEKAFRDTLNGTMTNYHFRTKPYTVETCDDIKLDEAFSFYRERFANAGQFTLFVVGNFNIDSLKLYTEKYLASLPSVPGQDKWKDEGITYPKESLKKVVYKGIEQKCTVRLMIKGDFNWTREERFLTNALSEIFNIRLRESIREDKSGTYGVGGRISATNIPKPTFTTSIGFGCNPDRSEELVDGCKDVMKKLVDEPVKPEELNKVKELLKRDREVNLKENRYWLNMLESYHKNGEDLRKILDFDKMVDGLTVEKLHNAAKKYLDMSTMKTFIAMPEKK